MKLVGGEKKDADAQQITGDRHERFDEMKLDQSPGFALRFGGHFAHP
jgi:hypothetical protein